MLRISGKEGVVQVSELQSSRTKRCLFVKRGRSRVSLKTQTMENPLWRKEGSVPVALSQDPGKMNFPGDEKPCCEFIPCKGLCHGFFQALWFRAGCAQPKNQNQSPP